MVRIMMLTTKGRYAVMAMVDIAHHGATKPVNLASIASRQNITVPYLEQIFASLRKSGLVQSIRGPGGGYKLARGAENTHVSDIILAMEEHIKMTRCEDHSAKGCMSDNARCMTHDLWEGLSNHIYSYLRSVSLADIVSRGLTTKGDFLSRIAPEIMQNEVVA